MKKTQQLNSGSVLFIHKKDMVKVELYDGYMSKQCIATFYVPNKCKDEFGFIPSDIVRYRLKHDFGIEINHYSVCNKLE